MATGVQRSFGSSAPLALGSSRLRKSLNFVQHGDKLVVSGSDFIGSVAVQGGTTHAVGEILWSQYLGLEIMSNSRLGEFAKLYEKYKFRSFELVASGAQPSTAAHQMLMTYDYDPSDDVAVGDQGLHAAMGMTNSGYFKSWENSRLRIPAHRLDKWLYTSKGVDLPPGAGTDPRFYDCGYLALHNVLPFTASAGGDALVSLWAVFQVEFDIPQLQKISPCSYFAEATMNVAGGTTAFNSNDGWFEKLYTVGSLLSAMSSAYESACELVTWLGSYVTASNVTHTGRFMRLPAGTYQVTATLNATNATTGAASLALASTGTAMDKMIITPIATAFTGSRNPISNRLNGRMLVPDPAAPDNIMITSCIFTLSEEALVEFYLYSPTGKNIQVLAGAGSVNVRSRFTVEQVRSELRVPTYQTPTGALANGCPKFVTATDGVFYGQFDAVELVPPGWWVVEGVSGIPIIKRAQPPCGARAVEDDDLSDCADAVACEVAKSVTLQKLPADLQRQCAIALRK